METNYLKILLDDIYYTETDLRYNNVFGFKFSNKQMAEYKEFKTRLLKEKNENVVPLDLKSFNSDYVFFTLGKCLCNLQKAYLNLLLDDVRENKSTIVERNMSEILEARVYSELEGSMSIENVPTTRTRLDQIKKGATPTNKNEVIAKNMLKAIDFILDRPTFNKENLHELYEILSDGCLENEQMLNGGYYRDGDVYIDKYDGCPADKIDDCMNSLFDFVSSQIQNGSGIIKTFLPHICHYYILYVHPYYDYNGRTARMVSLWISVLSEIPQILPLFLSEAINDDRMNYYRALRETRNMDNDVTYFIVYVLNVAIRYSLVYKNLDFVTDELLKEGTTLSHIERVYVKKILLGAENGYFDYKKFLEIANVDISKQAALKVLNKLVEYGVLSSKINDKKVKLFSLEKKWIKYSVSAENR